MIYVIADADDLEEYYDTGTISRINDVQFMAELTTIAESCFRYYSRANKISICVIDFEKNLSNIYVFNKEVAVKISCTVA